MKKTDGFGIKDKNAMENILLSAKTLGLITKAKDGWKLTPIGWLLYAYINSTLGDILNKEEEIIFKTLSFNPILSKEVYMIVKENPGITKKELSRELEKVLPKYGIEHDPSWFVDRLTLFLTNCGVLKLGEVIPIIQHFKILRKLTKKCFLINFKNQKKLRNGNAGTKT